MRIGQYGGEIPLSTMEAVARSQREELNATAGTDPLSIRINQATNRALLIIGGGRVDTRSFNNDGAMDIARVMADRALEAVRDRLTTRLGAMLKDKMLRVRGAMAAKDYPGAVRYIEEVLKAAERIKRVQGGNRDAMKAAADEIAHSEFIEARDRGDPVVELAPGW